MKQKARKRITAYLLSLVMILGMIPLLPAQTYALSSQGDIILTFTSDAHNERGNEAANRLGSWIDSVNKYVSEDENATEGIDLMTFCGDMGISAGENQTDGNGSISQNDYWSFVQKVMDVAEAKLPGKVAYTTGNHEYEDGAYDYSKYGSYGDGQIQSKFKIDEVVASGDNYEVYVMGCRSRSQGYDNAQVSALESYLNNASSNKIYFIASHYPLHAIGSRTTSNADSVVTTLNNVITQKNLKVVFIWGHNHSQNDSMYTKVLVPGQTNNNSLQVNNNTTRTVNFYYIPAGCMSDTENQTGGPNRSEGASWIKAKGVMFRIPDDNSTASFGKFDRDGKLIDSQVDSQETLMDTSAWDSDFVAVDHVEISDKTLTLEIDGSKKLTAAVKPDNASNQDITWSSKNDSIAKVDTDGTVTGVSQGVTTIRATAKGGEFASCTVTVNEKSVSPDPGTDPGPDPGTDPGTNPDPAVTPQPADTTAEVNTAKQAAENQLDAAKSQANLAQYKDEQKVAIINLANEYETKIKAAKTKADVDKLIAEFKNKVNALPKANSSNNAVSNTANTVKATSLSLKSLKAGKNKLTVKWTAKAKVFDGYEVSYRIKGKKWKTTKVAGAAKSKKVIKKLKKGKSYQVRIRGYKNVSGTTVFGKYSKTKTKKVK